MWFFQSVDVHYVLFSYFRGWFSAKIEPLYRGNVWGSCWEQKRLSLTRGILNGPSFRGIVIWWDTWTRWLFFPSPKWGRKEEGVFPAQKFFVPQFYFFSTLSDPFFVPCKQEKLSAKREDKNIPSEIRGRLGVLFSLGFSSAHRGLIFTGNQQLPHWSFHWTLSFDRAEPVIHWIQLHISYEWALNLKIRILLAVLGVR